MKVNLKITTFFLTISLFGISQTAIAQNDSEKNTGGNSYTTAIGVRGGWNSGLSVKHFIKNNAAIEGIVGTRWHGLNITGLYEIQKNNAFGVSRLAWEYGLGARLGLYNGQYYREYKKDRYYDDRNYTVVSVVGILGLEYYFTEIPFTLGIDIIPYFDVVGRGRNYIDGSLALRYVF